ncbi:Alkaline phosphatase synthesis sensor protein PhoR [compost metagenome]
MARGSLSRLPLKGQPPRSITIGVTSLFAVVSGLLLASLGLLGLLPSGAWPTVLLAWSIGTLATSTITYVLGGGLWGPYSWLHRTIDLLTEGQLEFPQAPVAKEAGPLLRGITQIAAELKHYRTLDVESLILEKAELENVINSMTEALVIVDLDLRPVFINPALKAMAQTSDPGTASLDPWIRFQGRWAQPDQLGIIEEAMRRSPESPRTDIVELVQPRQYLKRYSSPLYNAERKQIGHLIICHDMTAEVEADRLKSEFISNASHELRTPVASLKVLVESLLDGAQDDPELRQSFLDDVYRELERLHVLVNDLLDLAAIESGRKRLQVKPIDARKVIEEAVATVVPQAKQRDVGLELKVPPALAVEADQVRLRQILVNLLANAVKFTPTGGQVRLQAAEGDEGVVFRVEDTGIGIPAKDLPHIFDRFFRVTRGRSRLQGGSGLGLTIVKQAIDAHHGRISVESTEGEGTTFEFVLPRTSRG